MSITQTHFISQIESYFLVYCHYEYLYNSIVLRERDGKPESVQSEYTIHIETITQIMMIMAVEIVQVRIQI